MVDNHASQPRRGHSGELYYEELRLLSRCGHRRSRGRSGAAARVGCSTCWGSAQRPRSRTWKRAGRIFIRGKRVCTHHMHTSTHTPPGRPPGDGALGGVRVDSKVRALGPHVAVRDSTYPVAHPHCLAGFEGQDRERSRRDQDPSHPRRVLQMGWLGTSRGRRCVALSCGGGAMTLVVHFTMVLVATTPRHPLRPTAYFWEFDGPTFSGSIGAAPVALYAWHGTES